MDLDANANTDTGADVLSHAATDGTGNWVVVWKSDENVGGTIGADWNILVRRRK